MQVSFCKRATNCRILLRKTINEDQAFCVFATLYTWTCLWVWHDSQWRAINIQICFACVTCHVYRWLTYQNPCTCLEGICHDIYTCVYVYIHVNMYVYVFFPFFSLYVCRWIYIDLPLLHSHVYALINWFSFNECVLYIYLSYDVPAFVHVVFTPYPLAWYMYMHLYAHMYACMFIHTHHYIS